MRKKVHKSLETQLTKANNLFELLGNCPKNETIGDNLVKAWSKINNDLYHTIACSISGGSDSDIMLDICWRCDKDNKIKFLWFDTGLEYEATKEHLKVLEDKYNIEIVRLKAKKPIPVSCKEYGQPFLSKRVSNYIHRLQLHNFEWEDKPLDVLLNKYCTWSEKKQSWVGCKCALEWWCNVYGDNSRFNIARNKWLKEFLLENPPKFKISDSCCQYAKKNVAKNYLKNSAVDLNITGVRKAEGGNRASAYKNCFDTNENGFDNYRPLFWYTNNDKRCYEETYGIKHSKCYTEYGLKRTGCAGCPFGRDFEYELEMIKKYEPKLYKAVNNIFGDSYEYTRQYRDFCEKKNEELQNKKE